jgi:hypothetical protein
VSWFPQFLLAIIAVVSCWIAVQQMLIAHKKLNHDLFDRRFAVFLATRDYMRAVLGQDKDIDSKASAYHDAIASAPFLFEKDITDFVQEVEKRGNAAIISGRSLARVPIDRHKNAAMLSESLDWLQREVDNERLTRRFQPALNLSRLEPLSIKSVFPSNLEHIRTKVVGYATRCARTNISIRR